MQFVVLGLYGRLLAFFHSVMEEGVLVFVYGNVSLDDVLCDSFGLLHNLVVGCLDGVLFGAEGNELCNWYVGCL